MDNHYLLKIGFAEIPSIKANPRLSLIVKHQFGLLFQKYQKKIAGAGPSTSIAPWPTSGEWGGWRRLFPSFAKSIDRIECGGHGDCMFHAIAAGLAELMPDAPQSITPNAQDLRNLAANTLTKANLENFRLAWDAPEGFEQFTSDLQIKYVRKAIRTPKNEWGDTAILQYLLQENSIFKSTGIGFAVLRMQRITYQKGDAREEKARHQRTFFLQTFADSSTKHLMLLFCEGNLSNQGAHWQLLRLKKGHHSCFIVQGLPHQLAMLRKPLKLMSKAWK